MKSFKLFYRLIGWLILGIFIFVLGLIFLIISTIYEWFTFRNMKKWAEEKGKIFYGNEDE
ncbi:hypothetical protein LCGC14_0544360 [marine sediment metagenome]|uniref:Uncharacterized protein n=1 Tax=marine sediment metagenome TaxID=412755 RepID=A0A0F9RWJ0_9ZZZZ